MEKSTLSGNMPKHNSFLRAHTFFSLKKSHLIEIICSLLILLFLYTAGSKLTNYRITSHEMDNQPFPDWMTPYLIWGISISELIAASLLFFNRTKRIGLWVSLILMILFTGYIGAVLLNFYDKVPCSCGGVIKELGWKNHLYFNLFFVGISILGLFLHTKMQKQNVET